MLHGDVIAGASAYDELDHEIVDADLAAYRPARTQQLPGEAEAGFAWSADEGEELTDEQLERLRTVDERPDDEVRRDVLRALLLDSLVPVSIDAQVRYGVVTLSGLVSAEGERADAKYLAGLVPGVYGVIDNMEIA